MPARRIFVLNVRDRFWTHATHLVVEEIMLKKSFISLFVAGLVILFPIRSLACACCAEPGTYFLNTSKPRGYSLDVVRDFTFERPADLYMTEAGFDMIDGLDPIKKEYESDTWTFETHFDLAASFTRNVWRFNLKTPKGAVGTLVLPMPAQMVTYKVDIHDEENRPNGPLLYKEFRFKGSPSSATGFTRSASIRGTTYFLVFQGRGNGCDNASDFTHWRLEIDGPKADYAFYGKLDTQAAATIDQKKERFGLP